VHLRNEVPCFKEWLRRMLIGKVVKNIFLTQHGKCKINSDRKIVRNFYFIYSLSTLKYMVHIKIHT